MLRGLSCSVDREAAVKQCSDRCTPEQAGQKFLGVSLVAIKAWAYKSMFTSFTLYHS